MDDDKKKRRCLNADERRALNAARVGVFIRQYGRKAQRGVEPNDRHFDRRIARLVRRLRPTDLDDLLRNDEA